MKKKFFALLLLTSLFSVLSAQTKLISFKSHSGNMDHFKVALEKNLFDLEFSNFGAAPTRRIKRARLDSLIHLSDSTVIMVTSSVCINLSSEDTSIWAAGKDTLLHHPLFGHQHYKDSIKKVLNKAYNFVNHVDSVAFIGYDNTPPDSKKKKKKTHKVKKKSKELKKKALKEKEKEEKSDSANGHKEKPEQGIQELSLQYQFFIIVGIGLLGMLFGFLSSTFRKGS